MTASLAQLRAADTELEEKIYQLKIELTLTGRKIAHAAERQSEVKKQIAERTLCKMRTV